MKKTIALLAVLASFTVIPARAQEVQVITVAPAPVGVVQKVKAGAHKTVDFLLKRPIVAVTKAVGTVVSAVAGTSYELVDQAEQFIIN